VAVLFGRHLVAHILVNGIFGVCRTAAQPSCSMFLHDIAEYHEKQACRDVREGVSEICERIYLLYSLVFSKKRIDGCYISRSGHGNHDIMATAAWTSASKAGCFDGAGEKMEESCQAVCWVGICWRLTYALNADGAGGAVTVFRLRTRRAGQLPSHVCRGRVPCRPEQLRPRCYGARDDSAKSHLTGVFNRLNGGMASVEHEASLAQRLAGRRRRRQAARDMGEGVCSLLVWCRVAMFAIAMFSIAVFASNVNAVAGVLAPGETGEKSRQPERRWPRVWRRKQFIIRWRRTSVVFSVWRVCVSSP